MASNVAGSSRISTASTLHGALGPTPTHPSEGIKHAQRTYSSGRSSDGATVSAGNPVQNEDMTAAQGRVINFFKVTRSHSRFLRFTDVSLMIYRLALLVLLCS